MKRTRIALMSLTAVSTFAAFAGTASATNYTNFLQGASFTGITVTPNFGSPVVEYTVTLAAGATMTYNNVTYNVDRIIGFYILAPGFNDNAQPALDPNGGFSDDSAAQNAGSVLGWRSNPNNGINAGGSRQFDFEAINFDRYTMFGFHVFLRIGEFFPGTTGNTGSVTGTLGNTLPTPSAAALLGLGGLMASRRRPRPEAE